MPRAAKTSSAESCGGLRPILAGDASPWDVLRGLREATVLEPKPAWKGRTWMLRRLTLAPLGLPQAGLVVVDGCIGARQTEDFRVQSFSKRASTRTSICLDTPADASEHRGVWRH